MNTPPGGDFDDDWLEQYRQRSRDANPSAGSAVESAVLREAHRLAAQAQRLHRWRWPAWSAVAAGIAASLWLLPQLHRLDSEPPQAALAAPRPADATSVTPFTDSAQTPAARASAPVVRGPAPVPPMSESAAGTSSPARQRASAPAADERATGVAARFADVNARDADGRTALMRAAVSGDADSVNQLIRQGADASLTDVHGASALDLARRYRHADIVRLLQRPQP